MKWTLLKYTSYRGLYISKYTYRRRDQAVAHVSSSKIAVIRVSVKNSQLIEALFEK